MLIHVPQAIAHAWLVDDQTFPKVLLCLVTMPPVNKVVRDMLLQSKDDWLVNSPDRPPPLLDFVTMRFNVAHHAMCDVAEQRGRSEPPLAFDFAFSSRSVASALAGKGSSWCVADARRIVVL